MAPNTVARAYRELETAGIVETHRRLGTFVARSDPAGRRDGGRRTACVRRDDPRLLGLDRADARRYLDAEFG